MACPHPDIRRFDGVRCCLACGEALFDTFASSETAQLAGEQGILDHHHYRYRDLNTALGQEIRLAILLPARESDPIGCEIIHVNLEDDPDYEAVSYTWAAEGGGTQKSYGLSCGNGSSINITPNCEAVLRQLRRRKVRRRLWIDSVCINQSNIGERNHQVGLMDVIYSKATRVLACIPNPTISCSELFEWIKKDEGIEMCDGLLRANIGLTLGRLFEVSYFRRVWVIQEILLARTAFLVVNRDQLCLLGKPLQRLQRTCQELYEIKTPFVLSWTPGERLYTDVWDGLLATSKCECTDPRDRVYAILSLLKPADRANIPVDYALELDTVYANVIAAIISSYQNLDVLYEVSYQLPEFRYDTNSRTWTPVHEIGTWIPGPSISPEQFASRLERRVRFGSPIMIEGGDATQFQNGSQGPWRRDIEVHLSTRPEELQRSLDNSVEQPVIIEISNRLRRDILPRISVRAHFIDAIRYVFNHADLDIEGRSDPVIGGFPVPPWAIPIFQDRNSDDGVDRGKFNFLDYEKFKAEKDACSCNRGWKWPFLTDHSVGLSPIALHSKWGTSVGCEVFAIDGVGDPFILHQIEPNRYRVVSPCYLWAALELDCWNPGSCKGEWVSGVRNRYKEQTRIIEIH